MKEPGLLSRQVVTTDYDGSVILNEVWDLTTPGCPLPRHIADENSLVGSANARFYKRQRRLSPSEYRRDILGIE